MLDSRSRVARARSERATAAAEGRVCASCQGERVWGRGGACGAWRRGAA